jgi:hypothetical protein
LLGILIFLSIQRNKVEESSTYAIHSLLPYGKFSISQIDAKENELIKEYSVNKPYDLISCFNNRFLLLSLTKNDSLLKSRIDLLDLKTGSYRKFASSPNQNFSSVFTFKNKIYAFIGGNDSSALFLHVYDKKGKLLKILLIDYAAMLNNNAFFIFGNDLWILSNQFHNKETEDAPFIYVIDLNTLQTKKVINLSKFFSGGMSMIFNQEDQEIYIAGLGNHPGVNRDINTYIHVFSFPDVKFKRKINVSDQPTKLIYLPNYHKLYARVGNTLKVIDVTQNKILKTFDLNINYLSEKSGFLYLSTIKYYFKKEGPTEVLKDVETKLLVLDTKTDEIIKKFIGDYGPVLQNIPIFKKE